MKRRKILSFAMALVMCISMCMPGLTAYAVDPGDTPPAEPECNCEDKCTEGSIDPDCSVCSADGADLDDCIGPHSEEEPATPPTNDLAGTPVLLSDPVNYVDENGSTQTCAIYTEVTSADSRWSNGWYVVTGSPLRNDGSIEVEGDVYLILADNASLEIDNGISVTEGNSLTIYGQTQQTGELEARSRNEGAAAIGGGGTITINGGIITAIASSSSHYEAGAGIGGNGGESAGTVTINGGTVTACGGYARTQRATGAGIGGGYLSTDGTVQITGGTVTAYSGPQYPRDDQMYAAAIGTGGCSVAYGESKINSITIGGTAIVNAIGQEGGCGIGAGNNGYVETINITGGDVTATGSTSSTYGKAGGAGIGTCSTGACGLISISGGTVMAIGGHESAGIGEGSTLNSTTVKTVQITGGNVTAKSGNNQSGIKSKSVDLQESNASGDALTIYGSGYFPLGIQTNSYARTCDYLLNLRFDDVNAGDEFVVVDKDGDIVKKITILEGPVEEETVVYNSTAFFVSGNQHYYIFPTDENREIIRDQIIEGSINNNSGKNCFNTTQRITTGQILRPQTKTISFRFRNAPEGASNLELPSSRNITLSDFANPKITSYETYSSVTDNEGTWTFVGWTPVSIFDSSGNVQFVTVYGDWAKEVTLSYNGAGGTPIPKEQTVAAGTEVTIPNQVPQKGTYIFGGWEDERGNVYHPGDSITLNKNTTLTAKWISTKVITVHFDMDGGTPQIDPIQITLREDKSPTLGSTTEFKDATATPPVKENHGFEGWVEDSTGKSVNSYYLSYAKTPDSITVRADWAYDLLTLCFDSNGGKPVEQTMRFLASQYNSDETQTYLKNFEEPIPVREGYQFDYWYFDLIKAMKSSPNEVIRQNAEAAEALMDGYEEKYANGTITETELKDYYELQAEAYQNIDSLMESTNCTFEEACGNILGNYAALLGVNSLSLTAQWTPNITIKPANMISYIGGDSYDGVVDETGSIVSSNGLPEPGFVLSFPEELSNIDVQNLYLQYKESNDNTLRWKFVKYGDGNHNVYRIEPADGTSQRDVRIEFINAYDERVTSDSFNTKDYLNQSLRIEIYGEGIEAGEVFFAYQDKEYGITVQSATLTVRGTTSDVEYAKVLSDAERIDKGKPGLVANTKTTYTINNSDVHVDDVSGISLLFDEIINDQGADRTDLLKARTDRELGTNGNNRYYDFKYLDLVDQNNGNTWVKADQNITVYWPLPEGTNANTHFELLHFADAHRSMTNAEIQTAIQVGDVERMTITEVTDTHVIFDVVPGGFSPFALVWETKSSSTVDPGPDPDPTPTEHTLRYDTNGGEKLQSETKKSSWTKDYEDLPIPERDGYTFAGWYRNSALTMPITGDIKVYGTVTIYAKWNKTVVDPDDTGVSDLLNTQDHKEYLHGYDTGLFGPNNDMTRAEAAQMFYNLLLDKDVPITVNFSDVPADAWYATAVNTLASLGLVEGVGNNQFAPERAITRAEFTVIAMRFTNGDVSGENIFSDVSTNDWFYDQVVGSIQYGWITGYEDGTFRPNTTIARAEVTTIVNRMLGRSADEDYVNQHEDDLRLFPDVSTDYWAYYQIVEATNAHDYRKDDSTESWLKLN